jgi:uncharacterized membrane protein YesL
MINPFRTFGSALRDLFDDFMLLIVCNLVWALLSLPLWIFALAMLGAGLPLMAALAALLGVLPAGPATAALFHVAFRVVDGRASKFSDFVDGMRQNVRVGIIITAIAVAGLVLIVVNLGFYIGVSNIFGGLMLGLWLYLLISWLGVLLYAYPLIFFQERPELRLIARNAFLMALGRPIFTFVTLLLMGVLLLLSSYLIVPIVLFTIALFAVWSTRATKTLIDDARRRREEAEAGAAAKGAPVAEERGRKGQVRPK